MTDSQNLTQNLVVKSNELITASYAMTVNEQRLLLACIGQIDSRKTLEGGKDGAVFRLTVEQARDLFYTKGDQRHAYRDMQEAAERLFERKVRINLGDNRELLTRFVQSIVFDPDNGHADLRFATEILPYLSQLERNFTKYRLSNIVQLTSSHAIRIYELIVSWATQGQWYKEIEITEFRELLGLGDKYKQNSQMKERVILPALEQINASTDFELDISFRKSKRAFKWVQFRFNRKADAAAAEEARKIQREMSEQGAINRSLDNKAETASKQQDWLSTLPNGTRFMRLSDESIWEKENDFLKNLTANSAMPLAMMRKPMENGEFVPHEF